MNEHTWIICGNFDNSLFFKKIVYSSFLQSLNTTPTPASPLSPSFLSLSLKGISCKTNRWDQDCQDFQNLSCLVEFGVKKLEYVKAGILLLSYIKKTKQNIGVITVGGDMQSH